MSRENEPDFMNEQHEICWLRQQLAAEHQRAERAEADNAALLDLLRDVIRCAPLDTRNVSDSDAQRWAHATHGRWERVARADHPGGALLERLRTLEEGLRKVREYALWVPTVPRSSAETLADIRSAIVTKVDALKVPHE